MRDPRLHICPIEIYSLDCVHRSGRGRRFDLSYLSKLKQDLMGTPLYYQKIKFIKKSTEGPSLKDFQISYFVSERRRRCYSSRLGPMRERRINGIIIVNFWAMAVDINGLLSTRS